MMTICIILASLAVGMILSTLELLAFHGVEDYEAWIGEENQGRDSL